MRDSIIMKDAVIGENCVVDKAIIAENCKIGDEVVTGNRERCTEQARNRTYILLDW